MFECKQKGCENWAIFNTYCDGHRCGYDRYCSKNVYECTRHKCEIKECNGRKFIFGYLYENQWIAEHFKYCKNHLEQRVCVKCFQARDGKSVCYSVDDSLFCKEHKCHVTECKNPSQIQGMCHDHYSQFVNKVLKNKVSANFEL